MDVTALIYTPDSSSCGHLVRDIGNIPFMEQYPKETLSIRFVASAVTNVVVYMMMH